MKGLFGMRLEARVALRRCSPPSFASQGVCSHKTITVEPRLSGLFDYPDFFSGPVFFMNINKL